MAESRKRKAGESRQKFTDRKRNTRELIDTFLIVCEGQKTEPNYFEKFLVKKKIKVEILGEGMNTCSLVEKAINEMDADAAKGNGKRYVQVWCVFDKNSFTDDNFNGAIQLAREKGIKVAYSNEAFELWYLLHFHYYNTGISREQYIEKLKDLLGHKYEKKSETMYKELLGKQNAAIANAKQLHASYASHRSPAKNNPCTTVFKLVEELNKFIEEPDECDD